MKTFSRILSLGILIAAFSAIFVVAQQEPAEASTVTALIMHDGQLVPGHIPPNVILDLENTVPADATGWRLIKVFKHTEFADAGTSFVLDVPSGSAGPVIETEDILIKLTTQFGFGAPDAGNSTLQLDVGVSGATEQFAKDVNMLGTTGTRTLGSATTSVKPRLVSAAPLTYRLTFTQSAKNLITANAGRVDIYAKQGPIKEF